VLCHDHHASNFKTSFAQQKPCKQRPLLGNRYDSHAYNNGKTKELRSLLGRIDAAMVKGGFLRSVPRSFK
jgi:hypothetical protein